MKVEVPAEARISPRADWLNARSERDFDRAEQLSLSLLSRRPDDDKVRRYLARLLDAHRRAKDSEKHWLILRDADASDFEAAYHVALYAFDRGVSAEEAASEAAPSANAIFKTAIAETLAHQVPALEGQFRHVAICGVAYSGTTLLDRILGGLPNVKSTGESHWITKIWADGAYRDMSLAESLDNVRFVPCTVCGARCEVLTREFRRAMAADNTDWYRKIAARLDTRILVSADKNLPKLSEKDPLLELSALVVFKSPEQAWRSQLEKLPPDQGSDFYDTECQNYIAVWARNYTAFLEHFEPEGPVVFLNFDSFAENPESLLRLVCARLDLSFDAGVLEKTVPGHAIGGNARAMRRLRDKEYGVEIAPLPEAALNPAQAAIIAADSNAQHVWHEMMRRHHQLAGSN